MKQFLKTLMRPDREVDPSQTVVARAANILQVGEFQFLQLAYFDWYGEEMPKSLLSRVFQQYMIRGDIPHWARNYARQILDLADQGHVDDNDPFFHRYDHDYVTHVSDGLRKFLTVCAVIVSVFVAGISISAVTVEETGSLLPPYFEEKDLPSDDG